MMAFMIRNKQSKQWLKHTRNKTVKKKKGVWTDDYKLAAIWTSRRGAISVSRRNCLNKESEIVELQLIED